jgi:cation-transporting ATPase E
VRRGGQRRRPGATLIRPQPVSARRKYARVLAGQVNAALPTPGRTVGQILRANLLTRFNAILGSLFAVVLVVGPLQDALFGIVLAANTGLGIVQELRAKRTLGRLAILTAADARVVRDGKPPSCRWRRSSSTTSSSCSQVTRPSSTP